MDLTNIKPEELKCKGTLSLFRHKIVVDKSEGARCKHCGKTVHQIKAEERARRLKRR